MFRKDSDGGRSVTDSGRSGRNWMASDDCIKTYKMVIQGSLRWLALRTKINLMERGWRCIDGVKKRGRERKKKVRSVCAEAENFRCGAEPCVALRCEAVCSIPTKLLDPPARD